MLLLVYGSGVSQEIMLLGNTVARKFVCSPEYKTGSYIIVSHLVLALILVGHLAQPTSKMNIFGGKGISTG